MEWEHITELRQKIGIMTKRNGIRFSLRKLELSKPPNLQLLHTQSSFATIKKNIRFSICSYQQSLSPLWTLSNNYDWHRPSLPT